MDGQLKGDDTSLASSTLLADENNKDIFGLVISYSVRVKLLLGAIGGDLTAELPFVLMHPRLEQVFEALKPHNLHKMTDKHNFIQNRLIFTFTTSKPFKTHGTFQTQSPQNDQS